jgi:hypothetical protein
MNLKLSPTESISEDQDTVFLWNAGIYLWV